MKMIDMRKNLNNMCMCYGYEDCDGCKFAKNDKCTLSLDLKTYSPKELTCIASMLENEEY